MGRVCVYTKIKSDGYGTDWKAQCGKRVRCEGPIDVGFWPDPLPTENGKYCHNCGGKIKLAG